MADESDDEFDALLPKIKISFTSSETTSFANFDRDAEFLRSLDRDRDDTKEFIDSLLQTRRDNSLFLNETTATIDGNDAATKTNTQREIAASRNLDVITDADGNLGSNILPQFAKVDNPVIEDILDPTQPPPRFYHRSFFQINEKGIKWTQPLPQIRKEDSSAPGHEKLLESKIRDCWLIEHPSDRPLSEDLVRYLMFVAISRRNEAVSNGALWALKKCFCMESPLKRENKSSFIQNKKPRIFSSSISENKCWTPEWKDFLFYFQATGCHLTDLRQREYYEDNSFVKVEDSINPGAETAGEEDEVSSISRIDAIFQILSTCIPLWEDVSNVAQSVMDVCFLALLDERLGASKLSVQDCIASVLLKVPPSESPEKLCSKSILNATDKVRDKIYLAMCLPFQSSLSSIRNLVAVKIFKKEFDFSGDSYPKIFDGLLQKLEEEAQGTNLDYDKLFNLLDIATLLHERSVRDKLDDRSTYGRRMIKVLTTLSQHRKRNPRAMMLKEMALTFVSILPLYLGIQQSELRDDFTYDEMKDEPDAIPSLDASENF